MSVEERARAYVRPMSNGACQARDAVRYDEAGRFVMPAAQA